MKKLFRVPGSGFKVPGSNSRLETRDSKQGSLRGTLIKLIAAILVASAPAAAQIASDPTRPPGGLVTSDPGVGGDAGGGMMLQTVMISPTHKAAIINGVMVKLGEKYGDAVLVSVTENQVILKSGGAEQVLKFNSAVEKREVKPAVEKHEVKPAVAKNAPRQGKARSAAEPAAASGTTGR